MRIKPREIIPLLIKAGWRLVNVRGGSHAKFMKEGKHIVIPHYNHQNEIVNMNAQDKTLKELLTNFKN
jgi:predicted RNA binding protein YcfA (HicA-like mRNA interferase family)